MRLLNISLTLPIQGANQAQPYHLSHILSKSSCPYHDDDDDLSIAYRSNLFCAFALIRKYIEYGIESERCQIINNKLVA